MCRIVMSSFEVNIYSISEYTRTAEKPWKESVSSWLGLFYIQASAIVIAKATWQT